MTTQLILSCAWMLLAACALPVGSVTAGAGDADVGFGSETELGVDESVEVGGEVTVTFEEVLEDSRCPTGTTCVWEGNAKIELSVVTPERTDRITLNTNGRDDYPSRASAGSYTVYLQKLDPYPREGKPLDSEGYTATVRVTRGTSDM